MGQEANGIGQTPAREGMPGAGGCGDDVVSNIERARALLKSAGFIEGEPITYGHSPEIMRAQEEFACLDCGRPVGEQARGSAQCWDCVVAEIRDEIATHLVEHNRERARGPVIGWQEPRWRPGEVVGR